MIGSLPGILFYAENCGHVEDKVQLVANVIGTPAGIKSVQVEISAGLRRMRLQGMTTDQANQIACETLEPKI